MVKFIFFLRWSLVIKSSYRIGKNQAITIQNNGLETPKVDIPIDDLKYGHLIIKGEVVLIEHHGHKKILGSLKKYQSSIRKATFDNFPSNYFVNEWLRDITHLVVYQRDKQSPPAMCNHNEFPSFDKLKRLEMDVDSIYEELKGIF